VINDFFNAGELGMSLFKKFNVLELLFVLPLLVFEWRAKNKVTSVGVFIAGIIILVYITYLTPKIEELSIWWKEADSQGIMGINGVKDIQQEHQFFHRLYVTLDTVKLLILSSVLGFKLFRRTPIHSHA
jgi:uncharacterized membrane protein